MKRRMIGALGIGLMGVLALPLAATADQHWQSDPYSWCLACEDEPSREARFAIEIPSWGRQLVVRVKHGTDNSGDGQVEVLLLDATGRVLLAEKSGATGWEEFNVDVNPGRYTVLLRDEDTDAYGHAPGNGGEMAYRVVGPDLPPTPEPPKQVLTVDPTTDTEAYDWCLACTPDAAREKGFAIHVPEWARRLIIEVNHGYDDSGDGRVEVLLYDASGQLLMAKKSGAGDWEAFPVDVVPGRYTVVLRDSDTDRSGSSPGNGGRLKIRFEAGDGGMSASSASPALASAPETASLATAYKGCYRDQGELTGTRGRDLSGFVTASDTMTVSACVALCREKQFAYAGLQFGSWCFCGNDYGKSGPADNCTMPCSGQGGETCGGEWANAVYATSEGMQTPTLERTNLFLNPAYRVDHCLSFGRDCGKPAADRFCRDNGYRSAAEWDTAPASPTLVLGTKEICAGSYCVGFTRVRCQ